MFAASFKRVPPQVHEYAWSGCLLLGCVEIARTFGRGTTPAIAITWPLFMLGMVASMWAIREPRKWHQRLGWAYLPLSMNLVYFVIGPVVKAATDWRADALLQSIDLHLIGKNLSLRLEPFASSGLCDAFSLGYLFFLVLLPVFFVGYLVSGRHLERCFRGLFLLYGIGFSGYMLIPAAGPYVAMSGQFRTALHGGFLTALNWHVATTGSNHVDVFPSLHVGVSVFMWLTLLKDRRYLGLAMTPLMLLLWGSTIFLRFHYTIDVICGAALAIGCFWFTALESSSHSKIRNILNGHAAL